MEGLCKIWAEAIFDETRTIDKCPKILLKRVKKILSDLENEKK